jgi:hypothetical protein
VSSGDFVNLEDLSAQTFECAHRVGCVRVCERLCLYCVILKKKNEYNPSKIWFDSITLNYAIWFNLHHDAICYFLFLYTQVEF